MYPHLLVAAREQDKGPELTLLVDPLSEMAPGVASFALVLRNRLGFRVKMAIAAEAYVQVGFFFTSLK